MVKKTWKYAIFAWALVGDLQFLFAQTNVGGDVSGTWIRSGSPYIITDHLCIPSNKILTIQPGVQVRFDGRYEFRVQGTLYAIGKPDSMILFTRNRPTSESRGLGIIMDGWLGDDSRIDSSIIDYCIIEWGKADSSSGQLMGIWKYGGGIYCLYASPIITNSIFRNNYAIWGGAIACRFDGENRIHKGKIYRNLIINNAASYGGGIYLSGSQFEVMNNTIIGNSADEAGGIGSFTADQTTFSPLIKNNIIADTRSGSGILEWAGATMGFNNLWNNLPNDYLETSPGEGDVFADPQFIGGEPFDYHLQAGSPCIDAGDLESPMDRDNTRIDIGCYPFGPDLPPLPVNTLRAHAGNRQIVLQWINPNLIDFASTLIVRRTDRYPESPWDGSEVKRTFMTTFRDTALTNATTYFYSLFVLDEARQPSVGANICATPQYLPRTEISVPYDYETIGLAIKSASKGDTIRVAPGVYSPTTNGEVFPIVMVDSISVVSDSGATATILDAQQTNLVVRGSSYSTLRGFTITGGLNWGSWVPGTVEQISNGGGVYCRELRSFILSDNIILRNIVLEGGGGGVSCFNTEATIQNCKIRMNTAGGNRADGGGIAWDNPHCERASTIINNIITDNSALSGGGINIFTLGPVTIRGNLIARNAVSAAGHDTGGGISMQAAFWPMLIENNTIVYNYNTVFPDNISGVSAHGSYKTDTFRNNIVWGHHDGVEIEELTEFPVSYSCVEGGFDGIGNTFAKPMFADTLAGDYHLTIASPCIDAGDPNSPQDPDGTRADIGCFYYDQSPSVGIVEAGSEFPESFNLSPNFPNPFNPVTTIKYQVPKPSEVTLKVYNVLGQVIRNLVDGRQMAGYYSIRWDGKDDRGNAVANGVYLYRLRTKEFVETRKLTVLR